MWAKLLLIFFVFSFIFRSDHSFNQDLGRHLKLGEIILQTKTIPATNLFSYTNPNFPFINTHWLFEVTAYLISQAIGLQALLIAKVSIFIISVWLVLAIIPKENRALLLPIGFIFLHVLRERTELRPEIFSFFFAAAIYFILEKYLRKPTKLIYLLPLIQLLWINSHIYFFVGLGLQTIFLIHLAYRYLRFHLEKTKLKLLLLIFGISAAVSFINPNGIAGVLYPLNVSKNYGYTIVENQTMFLLESIKFSDPNFLFVKLALYISVLAFVIAAIKRRFIIKDILLLGFGVILALMNVRSFPYLVFLSFPAVLANFGPIKYAGITKILTLVFGAILLLESYFYLNGDYYRFRDNDSVAKLNLAENGKGALDFVIKNNLPGPVYNNFDIGSYIIFRGYPKYKVFVDGRPEAYPKDFFSQIYIPTESDHSKFKNLERKFGFQTIIFSITDQTPWGKDFLTSIVKDNDWRTVYLDDFMIILVKNDALASQGPALQTIDLSKLNPAAYQFDSYLSYLRLSLFLAQTGNLESAQKFAKAGLLLFPESPLGNALFGINIQNDTSLVLLRNKFFW